MGEIAVMLMTLSIEDFTTRTHAMWIVINYHMSIGILQIIQTELIPSALNSVEQLLQGVVKLTWFIN